MEVIHQRCKIIKRSQGRSAVGASAYRAGEKLHNKRDGITHDYSRRRGIVYSAVFLPRHAPREFYNREILWNSVEQAEKSSVAQLAREVELAIPNNLDRESQIDLVTRHIQKQFVEKGMCADIAIHDMGAGNPHAHILLTMRPLDKDGKWGAKSKREYVLDKNGQKIPLANGDFKSKKVTLTDWDDRSNAEKWHKIWAGECNKELEKCGIDRRFTNLTYEKQGLTLEPTQHIGVDAHQMEKRGIRTRAGDINREIMERNAKRIELEKEISHATEQLKKDEAELNQILAQEKEWEVEDTKFLERLAKYEAKLIEREEKIKQAKMIEQSEKAEQDKQMTPTPPKIQRQTLYVAPDHADPATKPVEKVTEPTPQHVKRDRPTPPTTETPQEKAPTLHEISQKYIGLSVEIKRQTRLTAELQSNIRLYESQREDITETAQTIKIYNENIATLKRERDNLSMFAVAERRQLDERVTKLENSKTQALNHLHREYGVADLSQMDSKFKDLEHNKATAQQKFDELPDINELNEHKQELEASYLRQHAKNEHEQPQPDQTKYSPIDRIAVREAENRLKQLTEPTQEKSHEKGREHERERSKGHDYW